MTMFADIHATVLAALDEICAEGRLPAGLDMRAVAVEPPRDAAVLDQAVGRQKRVDLHTGKRVKHSFRAPKSRKGTGSHGGSECLVVVQHDNVPKVDKV